MFEFLKRSELPDFPVATKATPITQESASTKAKSKIEKELSVVTKHIHFQIAF